MASPIRPALMTLVLAFGLASPTQAQMPDGAAQVPTPDDVPAHLAVLAGTVRLERDGVAKPAELNTVLLAGDRLITDRGRVEIMFGDGSALDLDNATTAELVSDSLVRLRAGALRLSIARLSNDIDYRIEAAGASAHVASAGDFLISLIDARRVPELDLAVYRGTAELENAHGRIVVRAGLHAWAAEDTAPSTPASFNPSASDDFGAWVGDQRSAQVTSDASYLPSEMRAYSGALDASGTWQNDPTYGEVWYPQVDSGWQPYSDGYWSSAGGYGWFWVGRTPWSYPTHHYGRWGNASGRWFWVPDHHWGPGWVNWSTTPGFVGWQPMGPTAGNGHTHTTFTPAPLPDMHRGWTTMPSQQLGLPGFPVWPSPPPIPGAPSTAPRPGGGSLMPPVPPGGGSPLRSPTGTRTKILPRPQPLPAAPSQMMSRDLDASPGRELHSPSHANGAPSAFSTPSFPSFPSSSLPSSRSAPVSRLPSPVSGPATSPARMGRSGGRGDERGPAQLPAHPSDKPSDKSSGGRSEQPFHPGLVPSQFSRPAPPPSAPAGAGRSAPAGRGRGGA